MSGMKRPGLAVAAVALLAALAGGAYYFFAPRRTPAGQAPLGNLDPETLNPLRERFNAAADAPRLVALLSPT